MKLSMLLAIYASLLSAGCRSSSSSTPQDIEVNTSRRNELVLSSQVFQGINNPSEKTEIEIKNGPFPDGAKKGKNYFEWGEELTCNFSDLNFTKPPRGMSPKFICDLTNKDGQILAKAVKIKYDRSNPEVYNELAASRLFWLLGFPSDNYFSVKVRCLGCPLEADAWEFIKNYKLATVNDQSKMRAQVEALRNTGKSRLYEPALIEKKWAEAIEIEGQEDAGWSFFDDLSIDPKRLNFPAEQQAEQIAQRHALAILAAMLSHVDNQPGNQRIYCRAAADKLDCPSDQTWLVIHDLGATMGGFRLSWDNRTAVRDSAQLAIAMGIWQNPVSTGVFTGPATCKVSVASLASTQTLGPIKQVPVSEAGRQFLLSRFYALGNGTSWSEAVEKTLRRQLYSVFLAGRNGELYQNTDWWVDTLLSKLEIVRNYRGCI